MSTTQATWTIIAAVAAIVGLQSYWIGRSIDGLRNEMVVRFEALERDLQRLYERVFHEE